jgi:hypothetical protein
MNRFPSSGKVHLIPQLWLSALLTGLPPLLETSRAFPLGWLLSFGTKIIIINIVTWGPAIDLSLSYLSFSSLPPLSL